MSKSVCLVIPARNAAETLRECLQAALEIKSQGELTRIIVCDDGSTDATPQIAQELGVSCIRSKPKGRSAARNLGWREASEEAIWFMDADCIPERDALTHLLACLDDPSVGGAGGSFVMRQPAPLLATLIHEEIVERHRCMGNRVNFVATGNAVYLRNVLEQVGGFDEGFSRAQDAELAYRVRAAGYQLGFALKSRVRHYHDTCLLPYLRTQAKQGYWRVWLHGRHASHATGDSYSSLCDNLQPPVAMLLLAGAVSAYNPLGRVVALLALLTLIVLPIPMTLRILRNTGYRRCFYYAPMSAIRSFARGFGLAVGSLHFLLSTLRITKPPVAGHGT